mmetsp:Transcript_6825/g.15324  ORF Transcript_6825/g.15324 Transcript_6825/m.15324 type:complete len:230 (+) Transcript_6825:666-1355(+)
MVRHGESVWNKAQKEKDVASMLSNVDHPLNEAGRSQAEGLQSRLSSGGAAAEEMAGAELIMCSPLTRALQTCLIGLQPILVPADGIGRGVLLNPNLREKRNFGGKDSSGKWVGDKLQEGVHSALRMLYADSPSTAEALIGVPLDLKNVQDKWWLGSAESEHHVVDRITETMSQACALVQPTAPFVHFSCDGSVRNPRWFPPGTFQQEHIGGACRAFALFPRSDATFPKR